MESPKKRPDAAVDDILQELKNRGKTSPKADDKMLDDILAGLEKPGMGNRPAQTNRSMTDAIAAARAKEKHQNTANYQGDTKPVSLSSVLAAQKEKAEAGLPKAQKAQPLENDTEATKEFSVESAQKEGTKAATPLAVDTAEFSPSAPKEAKAKEPTTENGAGKTNTDIWATKVTNIWDTDAGPRVGKASAIDKVDPEKFSGDAELLSWFSDTQMLPGKKEMREAVKAQKKQQAADRKLEKKRGPAPVEEKLPEEQDSLTVEIEEDIFLQENLVEEAPVKKGLFSGWGKKKRNKKEQEEIITGSAFDEKPADAWDSEEGVFPTSASKKSKDKTQELSFNLELDEEKAAPSSIPKATKAAPLSAKPSTPASETAGVPSHVAAVTAAAGAAAITAFSIKPNGSRTAPLKDAAMPNDALQKEETHNTQTFDLDEAEALAEANRVPTAAFTQEFDKDPTAPPVADTPEAGKNLFVDDMVDDRFREFFQDTVIVNREEVEQSLKMRGRSRKRKKARTGLLTGEFSKMMDAVEDDAQLDLDPDLMVDADEFDDYNRPQDAEHVEKDITALQSSLTWRSIISGLLALFLIWQGLALSAGFPVPGFMDPVEKPLLFSLAYLVILVVAIILNFTTIATGLSGLVSQPSVDSPPALASVGALLQAVVLVVQVITQTPVDSTLFGGLAVLLLAFNSLGKRIRTASVLANFQLASAGVDHSAAYVVDAGQDIAFNIIRGLQEENPAILVSRPTTLVKGFLRQSFSPRVSDKNGRILGWILLGGSLLAAGIGFVQTQDLMVAISCLTAVLCIGAPLSSSLVAAVPAALLQKGTSRVGAVVPGWSAIEELGQVNVVMAGARDIFPPQSISLKGIKTFEKERVDLAILYAASVLVEGCDTLRDIFMGVIQGKSDMLYKVESLMCESGRGFSAWVQNSRIIIGNREMLQKHDIDPPPIEIEMKYVDTGFYPVYLAVSGRLFAMFIIGYRPDYEVKVTLESLIKSGVSVLVTSNDMNITSELVEKVYNLPPGVVKVLGRRELDLLTPLTEYLPESEGVMTHIGTFTSFIGGMRAAAGCAAAESMSGIVQIASVILALLLCLLLAISGGLPVISIGLAILYQVGWTVLVSALPFGRRY